MTEDHIRYLKAADNVPLMTTALPCAVHGKHIPASHQNHYHHVWPRGTGGPDIKANQVVVCPTGHYNIHQLLDLFLLHSGEVPYSTLRTFAFEERRLARLGWERITRGAM